MDSIDRDMHIAVQETMENLRYHTDCPDFDPDNWPDYTGVILRVLVENEATSIARLQDKRMLPLRDIVDLLPPKDTSSEPLLNKDQCRYRLEKLVDKGWVNVEHVERGGGKPEQRYWVYGEGFVLARGLQRLEHMFGGIPEPVEPRHLIELSTVVSNTLEYAQDAIQRSKNTANQIQELEARIDELERE